MRLILLACFFGMAMFSTACLAQQWGIGAAGGFGWYDDATITNSDGSARVGFKPSFAFGVAFDQDMYKYVGGELRYTFRNGQPELKSHGTVASGGGYTNVITYDLLAYAASKESRIRPFFAGGAGIKVFTGSVNPYLNQPLANFALLTKVNQVKPVISVGGGLQYMLSRKAQFRLDFRTYMSPLPDQLFRPTGLSTIHGWLYDFVPLVGFSYVF